MKNDTKKSSTYDSARGMLLLVVLFTVLNIILNVTGGDSYFLFSASFPFFLVNLGMMLCGRYPEEFYEGDLSEMEFFGTEFFVIMLAIALLITALYFFFWLMSSRRRVGWLLAALITFAVDTVLFLLIYGFAVDVLLDLIIHVVVLGYLIVGVRAGYRERREPESSNPPPRLEL